MNSVLHNAINESNQMNEVIEKMQQSPEANYQVNFRFHVGRGNNDAVVRQVIK